MDYEKRGYLHDEFRFFHITDRVQREFEYHYHDFYKVLILLSGSVTYTIEGRTYLLSPYDIVFVNAGEIHRPTVHGSTPYERIILYISPDFFPAWRTQDYDPEYCFIKAREQNSHVLRIPDFRQSLLYRQTMELPASASDSDYGHALHHRLRFLEFMLQLNRAAVHKHIRYMEVQSSNDKILQILEYIRANLTEDISPERIADIFYLNKYYLMHLFKEETGYTLWNYITNKRLLYARELLQKNIPATQVCYECGFRNYSTFSRAYKKCFQELPAHARRRPQPMEKESES